MPTDIGGSARVRPITFPSRAPLDGVRLVIHDRAVYIRVPGILAAAWIFTLVYSGSLAGAPTAILLQEEFVGGKLADGLWDARLLDAAGRSHATFDWLGGGGLFFRGAPLPDAPSLYSVQRFDRVPGRCLAVAFCGTVTRGGPKDNPTIQFSAAIRPGERESDGPGWYPGQHQGRFVNTAVPLVEVCGGRNYAERNDNIDTLFLTVLRSRGAFYLMCGEPTSKPPQARLCHVSHTGAGGPYHAAVAGGRANFNVNAIAVEDLAGPWTEEFGLATLLDRFQRSELGHPDKGGSPWTATGEWKLDSRRLVSAGHESLLLTDAGTADGQFEVTVTPAAETRAAGIVVRGRDDKNFLRFELSRAGTRFIKRVDGKESEIAPASWREVKIAPGEPHRLAIRVEGGLVNFYLDDRLAQYGLETPSKLFEEFLSGGTRVGLWASGAGAAFDHFVGWPCFVTVPEELTRLLPPVRLHADGEIILQDDFTGANGASLEGRRPKIGAGAWTIGNGNWTIQNGAATISALPGFALIDSGVDDYEVSATIELPKDAPGGDHDWFPGIVGRARGAGRTWESVGGIHARFLWQNASNEIEVWDRPTDSPENTARWAPESGPGAGHIATELINATNITPTIRPGQTHVLRMLVRGNRVSYFRDDTLVGTAWTRIPNGHWVGLNIDPHGDPAIRWLDFTVRSFR